MLKSIRTKLSLSGLVVIGVPILLGSSLAGAATLPHDFAGIGAMVSALVYALSFDWRIACRHPPYVFTEVKMPDYRWFRVSGGTYFLTVNLLERRLDTLVRHIDVLREAVRVTKRERPFHIDAWVVLPDHMHCIWTLPPGDDDFSNRWKAIKIRFVQKIPATERRSKVRVARHERGVWQRRFWEHSIRDDYDYATHIDYCHWNPMKHGLVQRVADWPYSSFHQYVHRGLILEDWAGGIAEQEGLYGEST